MLISDAAALSGSDAGTMDEERKDLGLALELQVGISESDV
jgi:hypothetical protein